MKHHPYPHHAEESASPWALCIRLAVGLVFLPEGIQKLLYPEILGAGRFVRIGIPFPEWTGPFVGQVEWICGALILAGCLTRPAAALLAIVMIVAFISTKIPIWMGKDWAISEHLVFHVRPLKRYGFWSFMHQSRTDWAMLMGCCYLLAGGGGTWSIDNLLARKTEREQEPNAPKQNRSLPKIS